jgi:hypothetical protein
MKTLNEIDKLLGLEPKLNPVKAWRIRRAEKHIQRAKRIIEVARQSIKRERALIKKLKK